MKILKKLRRRIWNKFLKNAKLSYSQSGEDMILNTIFCDVTEGFYIDIGANNPYVQSNTHFFYQKGWRGVSIDALPGSMEIFKQIRPRDINIEAAIGNDEKELTYYMFSSSFYNTFSDINIEKIKKVTKLIGSKKIKTIKLENLLDTLEIRDIDFLSIDVEGLDYDVLKSNNWDKYRPKIIVTECFLRGLDSDSIKSDNVYQYLNNIGYSLFCNSSSNLFYIENNFLKYRFGDS